MSKFSKTIATTTGIIVTSAGMMMAANANAQTCTPSPACAELGYNKILADCPDNAVKCPWDSNKVFCNNPAVAERPKCQIGWIYYSDNTCSLDKVAGKTALGVVVYVNADGIGGQVMTARDLGRMLWSDILKIDIPGLPSYDRPELALHDLNSCSNTDIIVAFGDSSKFPAAHAVRNYAPTPKTKGKWCLPAAGIMRSISYNQSAVQEGIAKLGGTALPACCTWSSTATFYHDWNAWTLHLTVSYGLSVSGSNGIYYDAILYVRPVLEF